MTRSLPRSPAADQQVDPGAVLALVDALEARPGVEMHSLMVLRHGVVVAEGEWAPYAASRPQLLYSLSKAFTSAAAGMAQAEGLLDLDDTLLSHFPGLDPEVVDARSRATTLRHVAAMASGHTRDLLGEAADLDPADPVRGLLLIPPDREPGTVFAYSQPCTFALGAVVQERSRQPLTEFLRPRLLDPLGIGPVGWRTWSGGWQQGFSGLFARTEDVAKLGQLLLQRGRWGDRQLLPEQWVAAASARQVDTPDQLERDWRLGYGFQLWQSRHGYRGDGAFGQFCLVLPEQDAVVVTTACTEDMQAVLDAVWTSLLPGLGVRTSDPDVQARLEKRLAGLHLPAAGGGQGPPAAGGPYEVRHDGVQSSVSSLVQVELSGSGDGWHVRLVEAGNALAFPVGAGEWAVSEPEDGRGDRVPVAASGGWRDDDTARVEVLFLETPHRIDVELHLPTRTARAVWRLQPLGDSDLASMHCP